MALETPTRPGDGRKPLPSLAALLSFLRLGRGNRQSSPPLAALLSFLWPGLGQLYAGQRRLAAVFAIPALALLLLLVYQLRRGVVVFAAQFADSSYTMWVLLIVLLLGLWRAASVALAFLAGDEHRTSRVVGRAVAIALVAVVVLSHAAAGYMLWVTYDAGSKAFSPNNALIDVATQPPSLAPGQTASPRPAATPTPLPLISGRKTILFTGVDSDPLRAEHLYDSIMVVSYDPSSNSARMVSVPRDSASYPLYFGGQVTDTVRINSLPTYVRNGWVQSPDDPYTTLIKEVGYLVGIPIDYYVVMDLNGFVKMVDMVGGIDVNNPSDIYDSAYEWPIGTYGVFQLSAGPHHLDGAGALAYVRSRHGENNSDWARASRQQEVIVDLLHKMAQPSQLLALPNLVSTLGSIVTTNFPRDQVADYVAAAEAIPSGNIQGVVLGPPYSIVTNTPTAATTCLLNYKVAELSVQFFGKDSSWYGKPAPASTCPAVP